MITNLKGRLRNTNLPKTNGLLPLFEAVVNSIHSIEERTSNMTQGFIKVEIIRDPQERLQLDIDDKKRGPEAVANVIGFKIYDDGVGFTDKNMESFQTLDSEYKFDKGCRGVGRLLWLKAFESVQIKSTYSEGEKSFLRKFLFNSTEGVSCLELVEPISNSMNSTMVFLKDFKEDYQRYSRKTTQAIASAIFEHCLWYFIRDGGAPSIEVTDNDVLINLNDTYDEHMITSAEKQTIKVGAYNFELTHVKLLDTSSSVSTLAYCAGSRLVKEENINGKIPGLFGRIEDEKNGFVYTCYINSEYLDERVRAERTDFNFNDYDDLFDPDGPKISEVRSAVLCEVQSFLKYFLEQNKVKAKERVESFVSTIAPRYRPILSRIPDEELYVDPCISDKDLELTLHHYLNKIETELLSEGHEVLTPRENEEQEQYKIRIKEYLDKVSDIKMSDLAGYVSHRRVIIDMFRKALETDIQGKYSKEEIIHELIMPMGKDTNEIFQDDANLWLIDERLAFHHYLASDKTLKSNPITGSGCTKEPDLIALNIYDNPLLVSESSKTPLASIVVVELKRPMRNDSAEGEAKDPINQALGYLDRVRKGEIMTSSGRPIPRSDQIPGYCYVICDLTPKMIERCIAHDATPTQDQMGYFFYHKHYKAHVQVISFDQIVTMSEERNKAFFDKLGFPAVK